MSEACCTEKLGKEYFRITVVFLFAGTSIWSSLPEYLYVFRILVLENIVSYHWFTMDEDIEFEIFSKKNAT